MTAPAGGAPFSHVLRRVDGSGEAARTADRAAHLARSPGARLSFAPIGTPHARGGGFEEHARIEGVTEPMPPSIAGDVGA